ncbi:hypothetical protein Poli38472_014415 [Pythium oligandrum]|uniref:BZIP domain-containing protein n=1 Tax=Pythium oligandrum TaxID=41045 RepID=A0A8K1FFM7_PYTOL|nr:hypothetical protein Poli38472_014415 [Pythium oligandrum]|eukprot:TMW57812.1 hypothetical protein Poli38472_014415 [Pythium oligandrum]
MSVVMLPSIHSATSALSQLKTDNAYLLPPRPDEDPARRAKTNSERGKEFRAKRKKYEGELETAVYRLRAQVADLTLSRSVWERKLLETRQCETGSLVRLIRQYFDMFRFGLRDSTHLAGTKRTLMPSDPTADHIRQQELFIRQVMDQNVSVGDQAGPEASIAQWRMYTISHDSLRNEPYRIVTLGSEELPVVEVYSKVRARISRNTFRFMFPSALGREDLVQKFLHREVVYDSVFRFQFTEEGKIAVESADIGFVDGLLAAGFSLNEITELMQLSVVTPQCMIPEPVEVEEPSPSTSKLNVGFLLTADETEA